MKLEGDYQMQTTKTTNYRIASLRGGLSKAKYQKQTTKIQSTKNTNYKIASWGEGELPKANYQMQTTESPSGRGETTKCKLPNTKCKLPKLPTHSWRGTTKDN